MSGNNHSPRERVVVYVQRKTRDEAMNQRGTGPNWASRQTRRQRFRLWLLNILLPKT